MLIPVFLLFSFHYLARADDGSHIKDFAVKSSDEISSNDQTKTQEPKESWCDTVKRARSKLDPMFHIDVPCEKMKPAKSAIVSMITGGAPEGKGSRFVFEGGDYVKGTLALGASLLDNLKSDNVHKLLLVKKGFPLPEEHVKNLEAVGWTMGVSPDINVEAKYMPRFGRYKNVYPKISIIGLEEYDCVFFVDADTLTVGSIDDLMTCSLFDKPEYIIAGGLDFYHRKWKVRNKFSVYNLHHDPTQQTGTYILLQHFNTGATLWKTSAAELERVFAKTKDESFMRRFESDQIFINEVYADRHDPAFNSKLLEAEINDDQSEFESMKKEFGQVQHLPWKYNAQTHVEFQNPSFWNKRAEDNRVLHFTERKGWQCPEKYSPPADKDSNRCTPNNNDLDCACREGYKWYTYLKKAYEITKK